MVAYKKVPTTYYIYEKAYKQKGKRLQENQIRRLFEQKESLLGSLRKHQEDGMCYCPKDKQEKLRFPCAWCLGNRTIKRLKV